MKKTVFIPPIVNWSFLRQLPQQMASQWAKHGYNVIYCNERTTIDLKKLKINENLTIYPNLEYALYEIVKNKIKIDIFYSTAAMTYGIIEKVNPKLVLYHSCDSFEQWKPIEPKMLKLADIVYCTSDYIFNIRKKEHKNVYLVRNGCNEEMINIKDYRKIETLKFLKKPICVFSGACGQWVSTYHLRNVAKDYYTVLVGYEFGKKIPENVQYYKALDHKDLVQFLYNMDIGLLPFNSKSEITQAASPIKLWEYLACGLPVVATDWNETNRKELKDVVFIAKEDNDFVELIERYYKLSDIDKKDIKNKCYKIAKENTWEKRFSIIEESLRKL